jgi:hypothetical protein
MRVVLVAAAAVLLTPAITAGATKPALAVTSVQPLTVRGVGFHARERVTIVAYAAGRHVATLLADARGAFVVRFRGVILRGCSGYAIQARGSMGSRASLRFMPECPPRGR